MLIEFTVGNFRSFKEPETFSMVAANLTSPDPRLDTESVIPVDKELKLLTSAAIYGRNSSGKSNLLAALRFMREFVLNSSRDTQATDAIHTEPFRLSTETRDKPSFFEIAFIIAGKRYRYGFEVDTERVVSEWLFTVPTIREALLFQREGSEIEVSSRFKEGRGLQERTRPNALFLSVAAQFNGEIATSILKWLGGFLVFVLDDSNFFATAFILASGLGYGSKIIQLIHNLDVGINDIQLRTTGLSDPEPRMGIDPQWTREEAIRRVQENISRRLDFISSELNDAIRSIHSVYNADGEPVSSEAFDFGETESEGTKKLFAMTGPLIIALDQGYSLVIDEIDTKLHPLITRAIISLFNSKETNPKSAQLIFATHDANLLDNRLLRRDQIWFVEKDRYGASHLVSLAEYRVRKEASFEKDYLQGRYGGVPSLGDLSHLFEDTHA